MTTYAGVNIFGVATETTEQGEPRRRQVQAYPNVDGLELVDVGGSGSSVTVRGHLVCADAAELQAMAALYRTLQNATAVAELVTNDGSVYPYAVLDAFRPTTAIMRGSDGSYIRAYEWSFRSLT